MKRLAFAIALLSAGVGAASAEQFYKWKDANGVWHYTSEAPPSGTDASTVQVSGGSKRNAAATTEPARPAVERNPNPELAPPGQNTAKAIAERRAVACDTARKRYDVLANSAAVEWDRDGDGTAERLDAVQQAVELEKAQRDIGAYCKQG